MTIRVLQGDCRDILPTLPANSVHCVVCSPPYYGLRDYGTAQWEGGDAQCDHRSPTMREGRNEDRPLLAGSAATNSAQLLLAARSICGKCGARRIDSQIGLEATPDEYIATMVAVFREVRRVLRDDGTVWCNMGDSYASSPAGNRVPSGISQWTPKRLDTPLEAYNTPAKSYGDAKPKDLLMMPARLALALQQDGWWLRSDIIWAKPNPMPESVTDRPTSAHEHVFLLSKAARYYYDADAVREPYNEASLSRYDSPLMGVAPGARKPGGDVERREREKGIRDPNPAGRNLRNVWTIATHSFPDAHFATFPPELAERCIKAGCPKDGTVLDPFAGAGTTGLVADRLQRNAVLIELSPAYCVMLRNRITNDAPLFAEVTGAPA